MKDYLVNSITIDVSSVELHRKHTESGVCIVLAQNAIKTPYKIHIFSVKLVIVSFVFVFFSVAIKIRTIPNLKKTIKGSLSGEFMCMSRIDFYVVNFSVFFCIWCLFVGFWVENSIF